MYRSASAMSPGHGSPHTSPCSMVSDPGLLGRVCWPVGAAQAPCSTTLRRMPGLAPRPAPAEVLPAGLRDASILVC